VIKAFIVKFAGVLVQISVQERTAAALIAAI
jgi:hypothetical protein